MRPGDEESLVEAAKQCEDCLCWLQHCEAECCHLFHFHLTPRSDVVYLEDVVRIHTPLTTDSARYYVLHGAAVDRDREIVVVPRASCKVSSTQLAVTMRCTALRDDLLCSLHESGKPECCEGFTWDTTTAGDSGLTPRCLFTYKLKGLPSVPGDGSGS
jgi:hypothetical protein